MKTVTYALMLAGLGLLAVGIAGKFIGDPNVVLGHKPFAVTVLANSLLSLAILSKLFEK